jgi:hypothetical protein
VGLAGPANGPSLGCAGERAGENRLGQAQVVAGFWPIANKSREIPSYFEMFFIKKYPIQIQIKFDFSTVPTRKIKYEHSSIKIKTCSDMNATDIFIK